MIRFYAKIKPNANHNKICGWLGEVVKIEVKAKPVDGQANKALINFLSEGVGVAKNSIRIKSGHTSRMKLLEIDEDITILELKRKLA